jgi:hypothetical protein
MDPGAIVGLIIAILMVVAHIIKSARENAEARAAQAGKQPQELEFIDDDELVLVSRPKPTKQPKATKQRPAERQSAKNVRSILDDVYGEPSRKQALTKKLAPQGEGQRFEADPGTLDTARIVAPTFDPTVKPELESITGIYEQEATSIERRSTQTVSLNIADWLAKPEGICQAVILAEILNRPKI